MANENVNPPRRGHLIGVGVGPGDPDLLTKRAIDTLVGADHVVAPSLAPDAVGRSEAIVRAALPDLSVHRFVFGMKETDPGPRPEDLDTLGSWLGDGHRVAFVTLGDPNCYSTFWSVVAAVAERRAQPEISTVPGIMAFQELTARSGRCLVDGAETLSVLTALEGTADLEAVAAQGGSGIVIYKGGRRMPDVAAVLERHGRLQDAVVGELLGLPGERVGPLERWRDQPAAYLATVIVPPKRSSPGGDDGPASMTRPAEGAA